MTEAEMREEEELRERFQREKAAAREDARLLRAQTIETEIRGIPEIEKRLTELEKRHDAVVKECKRLEGDFAHWADSLTQWQSRMNELKELCNG